MVCSLYIHTVLTAGPGVSKVLPIFQTAAMGEVCQAISTMSLGFSYEFEFPPKNPGGTNQDFQRVSKENREVVHVNVHIYILYVNVLIYVIY